MALLYLTTGVLIVSVQWRNAMYTGSLIDSNQHKWAPPKYVVQTHTQLNNHVTAVFLLKV